MPSITLYTRKACVQCTATKRVLDAENLIYTIVDLDLEPEAIDKIKGMGFVSLPVVETDIGSTGSWSGFRPDLIKALAA